MWATPRDGRSDARWTDARTNTQDGSNPGAGNVYHAAFSAVGQLMAAPLRLLRQHQEKPASLPNRPVNARRTKTMSKTTNSPLTQWARTVRDSVVAPVVIWYKRQRMIEELDGLSDRVLADIGLTRAGIRTAATQAYQPVRKATFVAATVALKAETRPAASNDQAKQSLAA